MISNKYSLVTLSLILIVFAHLSCSQQVTDFSYISSLKHKRVDYPVRFTYINRIDKWWPPSETLAQMAVPGYGRPHAYNYVALTFWTCEKGPIDISKMWDDPIKYFAQELGKSKQEVQKFIKKRYNDAGVSVMLSAFGAAEYPTTFGLDPVICAQKLGDYVRDNNFDGVDIDYEDNKAMDKGTGEQWLILFMRHLRKLLPYHIITHAPQGPYFTRGYISGGYRKVHKEVGHLIDFYNVQFYNQMSTTYETYESLFKNSGTISPETSIMEMRNFGGVPFDMLVIGKPASKDDVYNSGYVRPSELLEILMKGNREVGWSTGVMFWQFHSDQDGTVINQLSQVLKSIAQK